MKTNQGQSIGIACFGLNTSERAIFDRVIAFVAKKGKQFHFCESTEANLFIVNDDPDSIETAIRQQKKQLFIRVGRLVTDGIGDFNITRPLLVTRVMRTLDDAYQALKGSTPTIRDTAYTPSRQVQVKSTTVNRVAPTVKTPIKPRVPAWKKAIKRSVPVQAVEEKQYDFQALIVDDSAAIRKQLEIELRSTKIRADYAICGEEALEKVDKTQYDLIFLDIIMPGIDGYEVCEKLRKMSNYKKTPVIMLSGKTGPLDEVKGILAGASTYLAKPVKHKDFQATLNRLSKWLSFYA